MAKEKYLSAKPDHITHCPACRGVIMRDVKIDPDTCHVRFTMRCPHCQRDVTVEIAENAVHVKDMAL